MIVVAIIGILAAVAIPSYQDYTARAQVTEAVSLTSAMKTTLSDVYLSTGIWPADITDVGGSTSGKYVDSIVIESGAELSDPVVLMATMKADGVNSGIKNQTFAIASADGVDWVCGNAPNIGTGTSVANSADKTSMPSKFLPAACK